MDTLQLRKKNLLNLKDKLSIDVKREIHVKSKKLDHLQAITFTNERGKSSVPSQHQAFFQSQQLCAQKISTF
ncbi:HET-like protein [Sesbania bispinosa]|nr:HET-like protein [Sesbania bispinosa]